jgi:hypothetical protein
MRTQRYRLELLFVLREKSLPFRPRWRVAGGSGYPSFGYFIPTRYAKTSLDVSPAEFVAKVTVAVDGGGPAQAASICSQNCRKRKQLAATDVALEQRTIRD